MSKMFWLTEAQKARVRSFFPERHGRPWVDDLRMLSGIVSINRNGWRWAMRRRNTGLPRRSISVGAMTGTLPGSWSALPQRAPIQTRS